MGNQRAAITFTDDEVAAFITEQRIATLATLGPRGLPHLTAMWYAVLDGEIWFETKAKSQKAVNLFRNPACSILIEAGGTDYGQLRGVAQEGRVEITDDVDQLRRVAINVFERYQGPHDESLLPAIDATIAKRVAVRFVPERTRSWDHRKLG